MLRILSWNRQLLFGRTEVAIVPIFWPASAMAINNKYKLTGYNAFWYNVPWAIRGLGTK
jgi:peptide/nickel transport system substrate-binding protein